MNNDLVQFKYVEIGLSADGAEKIPIVREGYYVIKWLFLFAGTTADNVTISLIDWYASFLSSNGLISDRLTHLNNGTVR